MNKSVTIMIWRPQNTIPGVNGYFSVVDGGDEHYALVECDACEGAPGRWEFSPSVNSDETAQAVVRVQ